MIPRQRIYLVGLMGSGKSAVGRALARSLGWSFIDTDAVVEALAGRRISEIFAEQGEPVFRHEESAALRLASNRPLAVVATGGGIVLDAANRRLMRRSGVVIHLDVPPALLATRTARHRARRPLLAGGDPETTLASLLKQRLPLYREAAHHRVDGSGTVPQVLGRILGLLGGSSGR